LKTLEGVNPKVGYVAGLKSMSCVTDKHPMCKRIYSVWVGHTSQSK